MAKKKKSTKRKPTKMITYLKLFWVMLVAVLFFNTGLDYYSNFRLKAAIPDFYQARQRGMEDLRDGNYQTAVRNFEKAILVAEGYDERQPAQQVKSLIADIYEQKAEAHYRLWHLDDAATSLKKAISYTKGTSALGKINRKLGKVQGQIRQSDNERNDHEVYRMARGLGPAKSLEGKIVVAYVFLEDSSVSKWSKREINRITLKLNDVLAWYHEKARAHGVKRLKFVTRIFLQKKNPRLDAAIGGVLARKDSSLGYRFSTLHGAKSTEAFLNKLIQKEKADGAVLMIHLNHNGRSFAAYKYSKLSHNEFAVILEKPFKNDWAKVEYSQAHEGLHLFGAGDLYNIRDAKGYAPKDIMHRPSIYLSASTIEELTAYAIGWEDTLPATPFKVIDLGEQYD